MSALDLLGFGRALSLVGLLLLLAASPASAHTAGASGGAGYVSPEVLRLVCEDADGSGCPRGGELRLKGEGLAATDNVIFLGRRGRADDRVARPLEAGDHKVVVNVPTRARSGRIRAVVADSAANGPRLKVSRTAVSPAARGSGVFPVRARHTYGDGLGAGRGHQGQDIFATCGARLVSALDGTVTLTKWQDRAGNYVVIKADDGTSQAYMHMAGPALVEQGERVSAGEVIGRVGDTGRATGCHLHFELWSAPGWYEGGEPMDPYPVLKAWDRNS